MQLHPPHASLLHNKSLYAAPESHVHSKHTKRRPKAPQQPHQAVGTDVWLAVEEDALCKKRCSSSTCCQQCIGCHYQVMQCVSQVCGSISADASSALSHTSGAPMACSTPSTRRTGSLFRPILVVSLPSLPVESHAFASVPRHHIVQRPARASQRTYTATCSGHFPRTCSRPPLPIAQVAVWVEEAPHKESPDVPAPGLHWLSAFEEYHRHPRLRQGVGCKQPSWAAVESSDITKRREAGY